MNEYTVRKVKTVLMFLWAILCLVLIVFGQKGSGYPAIGLLLLGLAGLLLLLYTYNRSYK